MSLGFGGIYHPDPGRRSQNRRIRDADLAAIEAAGRVADSDAAIARRQRADELKTRADEISRRRAALVDVITASSVGPGCRWHARLEEISLTEQGAADDLEELDADIKYFAGLMRAFFATVARSWPQAIGQTKPFERDLPPWLIHGPRDGDLATGQIARAVDFQAWAEHRRTDAEQAADIHDALADLLAAVRDYEAVRRGDSR